MGRGDLVLGALMVALAITGAARAEVEITDAISREFSVLSDPVGPAEITDAVTREFSVLNGPVGPPEVTDVVSREFSVLNGSLSPAEMTEAISREFSVINGPLGPAEVTDAVAREFSVLNGPLGPAEVTDAVTREFSVFKHGAVSRRTHGSAGTFDVAVHVPGAVEPRQGGPTQVIVTFDREVHAPGGLDVSSVAVSSGTVSSVALTTHNGPQLVINLAGVQNAAPLTIAFPGLTDDEGQPLTDTLCIGVLAGDVSGDGVVNLTDLSNIRAELFRNVALGNFRMDVSADGVINLTDLSLGRDNLFSTTTCE